MMMRLLLPKSIFQETREIQVLLIRELGTKFVLKNKNTK